LSDLIAAAATPSVPSAIGILRLSGSGAAETAGRVFTPHSGTPLWQQEDRKLVYGTLFDREGNPVDKALATISRAPRTYTGEETAEIHCHGSPMVLAMGLEALFAAGARQALPGEFTKRAFLNGRLDLSQAEAVIDLIDAETPAAVRNAAGQLTGALSRRLEEIYSVLTDVSAHFCAVLDFPDEELDPFSKDTLAKALFDAGDDLSALLATYDRGRQLTRGVACAIVGSPNAGKSSLLNRLLGYDRSIVTPIPGTTRDTVEERCTLGGVLLRLIDTAGLRKSDDYVERLGAERSRAAAAEAELTLLVLDGAAPVSQEVREAMKLAEAAPRCICVVNKSDLPMVVDVEALASRFPHLCVVSAATGEGIENLEHAVAALFSAGGEGTGGDLLTNARQFSAASRAREAVEAAKRSLADGFPPDAVLSDVEEAMAALGELTGRSVSADVTSRIFERFCVGK